MKIIFSLVILFFPLSVSANSCWKDHDFDLEKAIKQAEIAFSGEVAYTRITSFRSKGNEPYIESVQAFFDQTENLDGQKLGPIELDLKGVCSCRYQFEVGVQYVVLAFKLNSGKYSVRDYKHIFTKEGFEYYKGKS